MLFDRAFFHRFPQRPLKTPMGGRHFSAHDVWYMRFPHRLSRRSFSHCCARQWPYVLGGPTPYRDWLWQVSGAANVDKWRGGQFVPDETSSRAGKTIKWGDRSTTVGVVDSRPLVADCSDDSGTPVNSPTRESSDIADTNRNTYQQYVQQEDPMESPRKSPRSWWVCLTKRTGILGQKFAPSTRELCPPFFLTNKRSTRVLSLVFCPTSPLALFCWHSFWPCNTNQSPSYIWLFLAQYFGQICFFVYSTPPTSWRFAIERLWFLPAAICSVYTVFNRTFLFLWFHV